MNNELVVRDERRVVAYRPGALNGEQVALLKNTIAKGCSDDELALFLAVAERAGLDPFQRQIHAIKMPGKPVVIHVGIDGHRLIAERSGRWRGSLGPYWCGADGKWLDVWLGNDAPLAAKFGVVKEGFAQPVFGIALLRVCRRPNAPIWTQDPAGMLAKCAESLAIRRAFPVETQGTRPSPELAGTWIDEETGAVVDAPEEPLPRERVPRGPWNHPDEPPSLPPAARPEAYAQQRVERAASQPDYTAATLGGATGRPLDTQRPDVPLPIQMPPGVRAVFTVPDYPPNAQCEECERRLTRGMWASSHRSHRRPLCPDHQQSWPTWEEQEATTGDMFGEPAGSPTGGENEDERSVRDEPEPR